MKTLVSIVALVSMLIFAPQAMADIGGSCHFHGNKPAAEATVHA